MFRGTLEPVEKSLYDAKMDKSAIHDIALVSPVEAVAYGAEESHGLQVLLVDGGNNSALAGHPSATTRVRAPQLEGGLVHVNDAILPGLPALQLPCKPGPLLHQPGLLGL